MKFCTITLGYLNPALNNPAPEFYSNYHDKPTKTLKVLENYLNTRGPRYPSIMGQISSSIAGPVLVLGFRLIRYCTKTASMSLKMGCTQNGLSWQSDRISTQYKLLTSGRCGAKCEALFNFMSSVITPTASPLVLKIPTLV